MIEVLVIGAAGRMGRFACELLQRSEGCEVVARLGAEHALERELERLQREREADDVRVGLDFTVAGCGHRHGRALLAAGLRPLIGTSGVTREEAAELDRDARARGLGGLVVPNFSLAMVRLQRALAGLAPGFQRAEIIELHHEKKRDAPSATARHTRELLHAAGLGEVAVHSVRLPGLYAHQEVLLGSAGETLTLRHDMLGPEAFGPGIVAAVRYAARAKGVAYGLEHALDS